MINLPTSYPEGRYSLGFVKKFISKFLLFSILITSTGFVYAQNAVCKPETWTSAKELYINRVKFSSDLTPEIEITSAYANGFQDFSNWTQKAKQYPGGTINVKAEGDKTARYKVWIDWNKSGSFEEPLELVYDSETGVDFASFSIHIPEGTIPGKYKIRIRNAYGIEYLGNVPTGEMDYEMAYSPCEPLKSYTDFNGNGWKFYGEAEDYEFEVIASPFCFPPVISAATNITHLTANLNWGASGKGASPVSYDIEWNNTGSFDGNPEISGINGISQTISELHSGTEYLYRVRTNCAEETSSWTLPESFVAGSFTPVEVSGFNEDVIANGNSSTVASTTTSVDSPIGPNLNNVLAVNGSFLNGISILNGLPQNGVLKNTNGTQAPYELKYYLQDYSTFNSLRINNQNTQTLTLNNPMELTTLYLAVTGSNGQPNLNIEVVYQTGSSDIFSDVAVNDWDGNSPYIAVAGSKIGRTLYSGPIYSTDNPRIYQVELVDLDYNRKISQIKITSTNSTSTQNIANIFAVSAAPRGPKILSVSENKFCSGESVSVSATAEADINWYLEETGGTPIKTTVSGESWSPVVTETTTFYVEADNGIFHGKRVPLTVSLSDVDLIAENSDWSVAASWSNNEVPTAENCVRIPNGKTVFVDTAEAIAKNLTVEDGGSLTVKEGRVLKVTDFISNGENNRDNFVIEKDANLIQINDDAVNTGAVSLKKEFVFSVARKQYNFVNSALVGQNLKTIYPGATYALRYDEATDYFVNTDGSYVPGRALAMKEGQTGNGEAVFKGVPFNGELDYELTKNGQGYNLVGNPYPSNLDLSLLYAANMDVMSPNVQFWDNRNNVIFEQQGSGYINQQYALYNIYTGAGIPAPNTPQQGEEDAKIPDGIVKVGNGFLAKANQPGTIHFDNSMRVATSGPDYYGKENGTNSGTDRYWLTMTSPNNIEVMTAVVYFQGGRDEYWLDDSDTMGNSDDIFTMAEDYQVVIQGRAPFRAYDQVRLGYRAYQEGTYIFSIYDQEGVFADGQKIYLIDKLLNMTVCLSDKAYKFQTRAGEFEDRFLIVYTKNTITSVDISIAGNQIGFAKKDNQIVINSSIDQIAEVEMFNLTGRPIYSKTDINSKEHRIPTAMYSKQIVVVIVKTVTGETVSRKFINN